MSDNLRNKMLRFEAEPPASAWEDIASALDQAASSYPQKLYQYEQQPAPEVWNKIATTLAASDISDTKIIPLKGFSKSFKYAAAAAIIATIAWGAFYLSNTNNTTNVAPQTVATNRANTNTTASSNTQPIIEKSDGSLIPDAESGKQFLEPASNGKRVYEPLANRKITTETEAKTSIEIPLNSLAAKMPEIKPQSKTIINEEAADRYMIATSDDGAVRLPKKAYSDFACALAANANAACKEKMEMLQNEMATSMTTDFAQFLDVLKNLQENR